VAFTFLNGRHLSKWPSLYKMAVTFQNGRHFTKWPSLYKMVVTLQNGRHFTKWPSLYKMAVTFKMVVIEPVFNSIGKMAKFLLKAANNNSNIKIIDLFVSVSLFQVSCRLVRLFSVFGSVTVHYTAQGITGTVDMAEGEYSKTFTVTSRDNEVPEQDYNYFINITRVTGGKQEFCFVYL
jgi:hypothetical protein